MVGMTNYWIAYYKAVFPHPNFFLLSLKFKKKNLILTKGIAGRLCSLKVSGFF